VEREGVVRRRGKLRYCSHSHSLSSSTVKQAPFSLHPLTHTHVPLPSVWDCLNSNHCHVLFFHADVHYIQFFVLDVVVRNVTHAFLLHAARQPALVLRPLTLTLVLDLADLERVGQGLAVLVQVALGLEGKAAGNAWVGPFTCDTNTQHSCNIEKGLQQ
jgi:hypothetical protein